MLHHREIYIKHKYRILTMPVCTELWDWMWDAEQGFRLVETRLQLLVGPSSFCSSLAHSSEKCPHMTLFSVWGRGKQAQITRFHCTCQAIGASSWSGKFTSEAGQASRSALNGGGRASGGGSRYRDNVETHWILCEHGTTRVRHPLP